MRILNIKLWTGMLILSAVASVTSAAIVGGIEWALASLGVMGLISMACIGICIAINVSRYSGSLLENERLKHDSVPAAPCDIDSIECADHDSSVEAAIISEEDKRLIMKHINELYMEELEESQETPVELSPVSEKDKKLIMAHIDELFKTGWEQSESKLS